MDSFDFSQYWLAVNSLFLKKKKHFYEKDNILIFARATPEMKTVVVQN